MTSAPWGLALYSSMLNQFLENVNQHYDQKAWHGTPYNFECFDIGKIGAGVGDQVHGLRAFDNAGTVPVYDKSCYVLHILRQAAQMNAILAARMADFY